MRPKSGVYELVVRIDACTDRMVFLGVATERFSLDAYVGACSNSWGWIGSRALWHGKTKVQADYGKKL